MVDGIATNYTLDMAAGLTQVLADGTNTYLYGNTRISQHAATTEYFLVDALGSVRQLVDAAGAVTLAQSYEPFGNTLTSEGDGVSAYQYTGEARDDSGLMYLRARYLNTGVGRFTSRDTWGGDYNRPLSLNRWGYVDGNPVNYSDPTGHIKQGQEAHKAESILVRLSLFGIVVKKDWGEYNISNITDPLSIINESSCGWAEGYWKLKELKWVEEAVDVLKRKLGGPTKIRSAVGEITVNNVRIPGLNSMMAPPGVLKNVFGGDIVILQNTTNEKWFKFGFIHEFGHVWDYRTGNRLSRNLMKELGTWVCIDTTGSVPCFWDPYRSIEPPPDTLIICINRPNDPKCEELPYSSTYGQSGPLFIGPGQEDWAQTFAYFVYRDYNKKTTIGLRSVRNQYVKKQIFNLH